MKSIVLILSAFAAFAQTPAAFEIATVKPSAEITSAMVQAGKIHAGVSIDAQRVDGLIGKYHVAIEFPPTGAQRCALQRHQCSSGSGRRGRGQAGGGCRARRVDLRRGGAPRIEPNRARRQ